MEIRPVRSRGATQEKAAFELKCSYTKEVARECARAQGAAPDLPVRVLTAACIPVVAALALYYYFIERQPLYAFALAIMTALLAWRMAIQGARASKGRARFSQGALYTVSLYRDRIVYATATARAEIRYDQIAYIRETERLYVAVAGNRSIAMSKDGLLQGGQDELRAFLGGRAQLRDARGRKKVR